jgi:glycolate oxidase subunit GlcD
VSTTAERDLTALLGRDVILSSVAAEYLVDATESQAQNGRADAVACPRTADDVVGVMAWCYAHDVPVVPRGGGTGFAGGAVPRDGGVVVSLKRMQAVRELNPGAWRMCLEAGTRTADTARYAREHGLYFPPDPGAAEQSQIGGNIATNAGGPHSFKYGVTGHWVTGLEVVLAPGERVVIGGPARKDMAGYDLRGLLIGSEGTLGIVTAAWLRLIPAPEVELPVMAFYPAAEPGGEALAAALASGVQAAVLEFLDGGALTASLASFPGPVPDRPAFALLAAADGTPAEAQRIRQELIEALSPGATAVHAPVVRREAAQLWRWRSGVSPAVTAQLGGKVSEDIVVPVERLLEAVRATRDIGRRHGLAACSWGHAGDGNLHSTFMVDRTNPADLERAASAAQELFELVAECDGSVSGEHGLGAVKTGALAYQWPERALGLHEDIKRLFDPKGLINPGKKLAR